MKKKVLVISVSNDAKGGVASVVTTFMNSDVLNNEFDIRYLHSHDPRGVLIKYTSLLKAYLFFPFLLLFNNFQVAHIHGSLKGSFFRKAYFLLWLRMFSIPAIYQCHAAQVERYFTSLSHNQLKLVQSIFGKYQLRLCLGSSWVSEFSRLTNQDWEVLFNPVPELALQKSAHENCNFTFMGELSERKGIHDLLNAFSQVQSSNARLLVAGNGDVEALKSLCRELNISSNVEFLGWINNQKKLELLAKTDVVVLPSYAEGLPMSVLEAMSVGLPVITTPVGAVEDAITHDLEGILVEPGNISEISQAISDLSNNACKRLQLGNEAKIKFLSSFKDDVVAKNLAGYYNRLIKEVN
jgi:glycosyltransferase involved in cell wall biosynthesis